jgi:hypothetical protein
MLLGDDSDSEVKIEINKDYAGHYNSWRQKEELQKCKCNQQLSLMHLDLISSTVFSLAMRSGCILF